MLTALIAYLHYEAPVEEQNFATLLEMLNTMQVLERPRNTRIRWTCCLRNWARKSPIPSQCASTSSTNYCRQTAKSILISCGARLAPFDIQELRNLTMYDELALDTLGDKKTALFLIMSDTDSTFNFLISMVYTQLFNLLCDKQTMCTAESGPSMYRCLIDECANTGRFPIWKSWWRPFAAVRSPLALFCRREVS